MGTDCLNSYTFQTAFVCLNSFTFRQPFPAPLPGLLGQDPHLLGGVGLAVVVGVSAGQDDLVGRLADIAAASPQYRALGRNFCLK